METTEIRMQNGEKCLTVRRARTEIKITARQLLSLFNGHGIGVSVPTFRFLISRPEFVPSFFFYAQANELELI